MSIKGILFDKDGTLIDVEKTHGPSSVEVVNALASGNEVTRRALAAAIELDLETARFGPTSIVIAGTADDIARAFGQHLSDSNHETLKLTIERLYDDVTVKHVSPFDDLNETIATLVEFGLPLGIATNDTLESANRHIDALGHRNAFGFLAGYNSGHGPKPGPGMVLAFADYLGCQPHEVMMVGDSLHDLHAGNAAGALTVGITTGLADRQALEPHADHVVASLFELVALIRTRL